MEPFGKRKTKLNYEMVSTRGKWKLFGNFRICFSFPIFFSPIEGEDEEGDENQNESFDTKSYTVKPRYTGPKSNGNPPTTNAKLWSLQVISFNFLYWQ